MCQKALALTKRRYSTVLLFKVYSCELKYHTWFYSTVRKKVYQIFYREFRQICFRRRGYSRSFRRHSSSKDGACPLNKKHTPEFMKHTKYVYVSNCLGAYLRSNSMACLAWERPLLLKTKVVLLLSILVNRHVVLCMNYC